MRTYSSIKDFKYISNNFPTGYSELLEILEQVNPCEQSYDYYDNSLVISYKLKLNLFNFFGKFTLYKNTRIVGLPISICERGYYGDPEVVKRIIKSKRGLTIVLNADESLGCKCQTLSSFIFRNNYSNFDKYLDNLRSPYRRRIKKALDKREKIEIIKINRTDFTDNHYSLYKSVMERTKDPLETLPYEFFKLYNAELYEILDKETNQIIAFFQLKEIGKILYFLFCGFRKEDNDKYDLYYNLLIKIVEIGIEKGVEEINFGQTSEESKLKIGCEVHKKYLCIYHSNPVLNKLLDFLLPYFSYKPYKIRHHVFKKDE